MASDEYVSPYTPNTQQDRRAMLDEIGVDSVGDLFKALPKDHLDPSLNLADPLSELEVRQRIGEMAAENAVPGDYACFLGAGVYRHFIPAVVKQIASRGEFMTSYTPYQPEISQGTLQSTYEFQSLICQLTGMDVANAGMYEGSSSMAEAALMACRVTKRHKVAVLDSVSPVYREVLDTYTKGPEIETVELSADDDIPDDVACVVVQQPNFFGYMVDLQDLASRVHDTGALLVVSHDLVALGMFRPPSEYEADIVTGEGQTLGIDPTFGGPYVGVFACRQEYLRQMPGRIVGKTVDTEDRTGFVLTLQAREQHIRRERATSNICTSVALIALGTTTYMAALGKRGLAHMADLCYQKAHYTASEISKLDGYSLPFEGTFFREFVVQCPKAPAEINEDLLDHGIIGGLDISDLVPNGVLLCTTEINTRDEIDKLVAAMNVIGGTA